MRILITRPEPKAQELADLLSQAGHECYVWPSLSIYPLQSLSEVQQQISMMKSKDVGIFVSPNSVSQLFPLLNSSQIQKIYDLECFAIGPATAQALIDSGKKDIQYPNKVANSEALLSMAELADMEGRRVWIFRGQSGRELIAETLKSRGAEIHYLCSYLSQPSTASIPDLLQAWQLPFDLVIATSLAGIKVLWGRLPDVYHLQLKHAMVTSMSEKMLTWLQNKGFDAILSLSSANNHDIADWVNQLEKELD